MVEKRHGILWRRGEMEETLAGVVAELEGAIVPLGFRIEAVQRNENGRFFIGSDAANGESITVTVVRKEKSLGTQSMDGVSETF
jgi:hypothetical protein